MSVSSSVEESSAPSINPKHSWKEQLCWSFSVDEGTVPPIRNQFLKVHCMCVKGVSVRMGRGVRLPQVTYPFIVLTCEIH